MKDKYQIIELKKLKYYLKNDFLPFLLIYLILILINENTDKNHFIKFIFPIILLLHIFVKLLSVWNLKFKVWMEYKQTNHSTNSLATHCYIAPPDHCGTAAIVQIQRKNRSRFFHFQNLKFEFVSNEFSRLRFPVDLSLKCYAESQGHESEESVVKAARQFGTNTLQTPSPTLIQQLIPQLTAPFFVFQTLCCVLWCLDEYWIYGLFTLCMLVVFELTQALSRLTGLKKLREGIYGGHFVYCYRNGRWRILRSDMLVAGDLLSVNSLPIKASSAGQQHSQHLCVPCDLLLLRGTAVVDESMLTGESIPQLKEALDLTQHENDSRCLDIQDPAFKRNLLVGGTLVLDHHMENPVNAFLSEESVLSDVKYPPDQGCICYVLRTGFETQQGHLLRTMIHFSGCDANNGVNNFDNFIFISLLLCCALYAAYLVLDHGWNDERRNRYKLILHVIIILTSVVPPELPMELSLAVTSSLSALIKKKIYCTEPYRIPLAGEVDFCAFDKTGTLTSDEMRVKGVRIVKEDNNIFCSGDRSTDDDLFLPTNNQGDSEANFPINTLRVMVGCQGLARSKDGQLLGDPLEIAVMNACSWTVLNSSTIVPEGGSVNDEGVEVLYRFPFESKLKRMTVICRDKGNNRRVFSTVKGAPEVIKDMIQHAPSNFDEVYQFHMSKGQRVLCLAYCELSRSKWMENVQTGGRSALEQNLIFAGFLVMDSPVKSGTRRIIKELKKSSDVVMITGDAMLTATEVARRVGIITSSAEPFQLIQAPPSKSEHKHANYAFVPLYETTSGSSNHHRFTINDICDFEALRGEVLTGKIALCVNGQTLTNLIAEFAGLSDVTLSDQGEQGSVLFDSQAIELLGKITPIISVFARHSPRQKEAIIISLNSVGKKTLMCGDGMNDSGALKQAHIGVSIISSPEIEAKLRSAETGIVEDAPRKKSKKTKNINKSKERTKVKKQSLEEALKEMSEAQQALEHVALGDASMASPFTSRTVNIKCCKDILLQGRCTLVSMLTIYKILGINCLITALSLSTLHMYGVKQGDTQLTCFGLIVSALFLFVTKGLPLEKLSDDRPASTVLCCSALLSISGQFIVHAVAMMTAVHVIKPFVDPDDPSLTPDGPFNPNSLNTVVFIMSIATTVGTFMINYKGQPFMQSLSDNKLLKRTIQACVVMIITCIFELFEPLSQVLQLSPLPASSSVAISTGEGVVSVGFEYLTSLVSFVELPTALMLVVLIDWTLAYAVEYSVSWIFG